MQTGPNDIYELPAALAFSRQAPVFDSIYKEDPVTLYKRKRVRDHISPYLAPSSSILELNCGTGEDAIWLARQGHQVHATDISTAMLKKLGEKIEESGLEDKIHTEACSFSSLENLTNRNQYDFIFSNFAGLNCTPHLKNVLHSLPSLVKPGGLVTLVLMPGFCLWEFLLLFKGRFKTAFRRFSGKKGTRANVEGQAFRCWYYSPSYLKKQMKDFFDQVAIEGLCSLVPPSYMAGFPDKHPALYRSLLKKEKRWKCKWPWRNIGDYFIITFRKKADQ